MLVEQYKPDELSYQKYKGLRTRLAATAALKYKKPQQLHPFCKPKPQNYIHTHTNICTHTQTHTQMHQSVISIYSEKNEDTLPER